MLNHQDYHHHTQPQYQLQQATQPLHMTNIHKVKPITQHKEQHTQIPHIPHQHTQQLNIQTTPQQQQHPHTLLNTLNHQVFQVPQVTAIQLEQLHINQQQHPHMSHMVIINHQHLHMFNQTTHQHTQPQHQQTMLIITMEQRKSLKLKRNLVIMKLVTKALDYHHQLEQQSLTIAIHHHTPQLNTAELPHIQQLTEEPPHIHHHTHQQPHMVQHHTLHQHIQVPHIPLQEQLMVEQPHMVLKHHIPQVFQQTLMVA